MLGVAADELLGVSDGEARGRAHERQRRVMDRAVGRALGVAVALPRVAVAVAAPGKGVQQGCAWTSAAKACSKSRAGRREAVARGRGGGSRRTCTRAASSRGSRKTRGWPPRTAGRGRCGSRAAAPSRERTAAPSARPPSGRRPRSGLRQGQRWAEAASSGHRASCERAEGPCGRTELGEERRLREQVDEGVEHRVRRDRAAAAPMRAEGARASATGLVPCPCRAQPAALLLPLDASGSSEVVAAGVRVGSPQGSRLMRQQPDDGLRCRSALCRGAVRAARRRTGRTWARSARRRASRPTGASCSRRRRRSRRPRRSRS